MKVPAGNPRNLPALLAALHEDKRTVAVLVPGTPGGAIHVREGMIVAVDTPGAPSPQSTLVKSGRVEDGAWAAAWAASGPQEYSLRDELQARGLLTPQEFEIACTAAVFDGAFALALGPGSDWEVRDPVPTVVVGRAFAPHVVAAETTRRLAALTHLWGSPAEFARTRIRPTDAPRPALSPRYTAVLDAANGRRTPRDLAFALGRGTYAVMLDLARLRTLGLVHHDMEAAAGRPSTAPRLPGPRSGGITPASGAPLPQRTPGTHHPHRSDTV
ncbi:hypothetical protein OG562_40470 [Streptomyces sp. NBC_01275]|uniref:hypothetical protein n=1 Tax=Streptomyces sp. NBC_01275 TaxID=2903807 RepID=UPI002258B3E9|nr:hypothetical protein [Streptomyces sp. NBC_01275]MCX4767139.1 hypothetical protein [Streptomyces sp. NBC_01275]